MTREERERPFFTQYDHHHPQWLFALLLTVNFLAAVGAVVSMLWSFRLETEPLLLMIVALGLVDAFCYRHLFRQHRGALRRSHELSGTQQRLQHQQQVWQHLRELYHQDIAEEHFLQAVQVALKELLDIPRISLWFFDALSGQMTCRSSLTPSLIGTQLNMQMLDDYIQALHKSPCLAASNAQSDSRLKGLRPFFEKHGIVSTLDVGIFVGGELRGTLCCESTVPRQWRGDELNTVMGVSGLLSQFAESLRRREVEHDLYQHIHYDVVTGLPTMRGLIEFIDTTGNRLQSFHLILLRVRGLGHINTLLGQGGGDEALRQVVAEIRQYLLPQRHLPRLARLPANQIAIILPGPRCDPWLQQRLSDMLASLTERVWQIQSQQCQLRFAAGMAHFPSDGESLEQVIQRAEIALKHARQQAPSLLVQYAQELGEWEIHQIRIERELRTAIDENQFRIYLQPQFDTAGSLKGAEALIRWQHPQNGLVAPGYFIKDAERSGLIRPIGYWILDQAIALLRGPLAGTDLTLSVNVSVWQLSDEEFLPRLEAKLEQSGFPPHRLVLEIVESLLATPGMAMTLYTLRQLGVQLALDDFGTGYSSLRYLQDFPVDEIKLDRIFIEPIKQGADATLARSIIAMARTLRLRLVAEGVETAGQLAFLHQQKASLMQGYYLAHPEPIDAFLERVPSATSLGK